MLVLDSNGIEQMLVGTVRWQDVEFMRKAERGHLLSRRTHTVLELRLRPGSRVLNRPLWLRPFPSPRRMLVRIEGLEFEPGKIRAVASALLAGGTWYIALGDEAFEQLQRKAGPLVAELGSELTGSGGTDFARLARIGRELQSAVSAQKAVAEMGLETRRHEGRLQRRFALAATAVCTVGMCLWLWF